MGHLRTGVLPRTRKWREVVLAIGSGQGLDEKAIADIAEKTLDASNQAFRQMPYDQAVQSCFQFLATLSVAGQSKNVKQAAAELGIHLDGEPTKLQLAKALRTWLEKNTKNSNPEFESLTRQATTDTIAAWINKEHKQSQINLFESADPYKPWRDASDGKGFCELSRSFFANLTSRYLNYFLSRTASAQFKTIEGREHFEKTVHDQSASIAQHALETSKLVQSFSAGWFNKRTVDRVPSTKEVEGFLRHALEKIREELRRQKETS